MKKIIRMGGIGRFLEGAYLFFSCLFFKLDLEL